MRGDEMKLGSPNEDMLSIVSVNTLPSVKRENKFLLAIGWGVDSYHGVSHTLCLENIAALIQANGFLGAFSCLKEMPEVELYKEACEYAFKRMNDVSIVSSSIISATDGHFGNYHATPRTQDSELFINPLMSLYWAFRLGPVADRIVFRAALEETESMHQVQQTMMVYRHEHYTPSELRVHTPFPH